MHGPKRDISAFLVRPEQTLQELIQCVDRNKSGIALVVDREARLLGTVTDGDIRRATLQRVSLTALVGDLLARRAAGIDPATGVPGLTPGAYARLMAERKVRQLPLVDGNRRVVGIVLQDDIASGTETTGRLSAVIMAGGKGSRMRPLTDDVPKPMLPVGGKPLLERIIARLQRAGIQSVNVTTHYLRERITEHFGDGRQFGIDLTYVDEQEPLGTAGALRLMERPAGPTLIINGDVLTDMDVRAMHEFHRDQGDLMTMAVRDFSMVVPYGVVESDGSHVRRIVEKPRHEYFINAGIYILEPEAFDFIPAGRHFDMTDLVDALLADGRRIASFPIREYWLDIGHHEDYRRAEIDMREGRVRA